MKEEIWKSIPGYEFIYEVSNLGGVRHTEKIIPDTYLICKVIPPRNLNIQEGQYSVLLCKDKVWINHKISRLVAETFLKDTPKKYVKFKDGNDLNWEASNLEWTDTKDKYISPRKNYTSSIFPQSFQELKKLSAIISVEEFIYD